MREKISKVLCVWRFTCDIMLQKTMKNMFFIMIMNGVNLDMMINIYLKCLY